MGLQERPGAVPPCARTASTHVPCFVWWERSCWSWEPGVYPASCQRHIPEANLEAPHPRAARLSHPGAAMSPSPCGFLGALQEHCCSPQPRLCTPNSLWSHCHRQVLSVPWSSSSPKCITSHRWDGFDGRINSVCQGCEIQST